jgi:crossover junction endodeoxyribonuclease RuvC
MTRRILGIDPGYDRLGVSVVSGTASKPEYIFSTCIETDREMDFPDRLLQIGRELQKIIQTQKPDVLSIEDIFIAKNQKTAIKVAEARGVCLLLGRSLGLKVEEYTPLQVKGTLTGFGKADKAQVSFMVKQILKLPNSFFSKKRHDDELDALALALTALFQNPRLK